MKRSALALVFAVQLATAWPVAATIDEYDESQSHPLRVTAFLLYPVGVVAEWLVFRPFHFLAAAAEPVFGHTPHNRIGER